MTGVPCKRSQRRLLVARTHRWLFVLAIVLLTGCTSESDSARAVARDICVSAQSKPADTEIACAKLIDAADSSVDDRVVSLFNRSASRSRTGDFTGAMADMNRALALKPDNAQVLGGRGVLYAMQGDLESAQRDFEAVIRLDPNDAATLTNLGTVYERKDQPEQALPYLERALKVDPAAANALGARCWVLTVLNRDLQSALSDCDRALKANPQDYNSFNSRGLVHYRLGQYEQAIADYDRAIAGDASSASSFYMRGMARRALGGGAQADADIAKGIQMNPGIAQRYAGFGVAAP